MHVYEIYVHEGRPKAEAAAYRSSEEGGELPESQHGAIGRRG
jgi:hypothetical protein